MLPVQPQAIIWTNAGILLIGPLGTHFCEILIKIHTFSFKKMYLKMLSGKWRLFCLGLSMLTNNGLCYLCTFSLLPHNEVSAELTNTLHCKVQCTSVDDIVGFKISTRLILDQLNLFCQKDAQLPVLKVPWVYPQQPIQTCVKCKVDGTLTCNMVTAPS